ncbi:hypothetical protein CCAX7_009540 [Capsulimonas corticalis]|uniref:Uncharacterized protein n=1 Tax=Capsulimonas corticalis TaxID=2219043 RepID=A0A402CU75_9BACT|nr:hypothetical protein [Capsulimonas corticalis]BDI28903.1 hypothetical protein CCAX7_009540 [Capsulimonas corticalis]
MAAAALAACAGGRVFAQDTAADVTLGGEVVMRLRSSAGGLTPQQRVGAIEERLTRLLAIPDITPADVVIYTPAGKPPVLYALGRRLIEVDDQTAASAGSPGESLKLATGWAKKLQQLLPRVNYRRPNEPEPTVPENPPLTITSDFSEVGGSTGQIYLRDKLVAVLRGPQPGGFTAAEYADILGPRLNVVAHRLGDGAADSVKVVDLSGYPIFGPSLILMGDRPMIVVESTEADAAKAPSSVVLANSWAKNLRTVLTMNPPSAAAAAPPP